MTKTITATYLDGVLRPSEPLDLPNGASVQLSVTSAAHAEAPFDPKRVFAILDEIAALSTEGINDGAPVAREHDRYLYGDKSEFARRRKE